MLTTHEIECAEVLLRAKPAKHNPGDVNAWARVVDLVANGLDDGAFGLRTAERAEDRSEWYSRCGYSAVTTMLEHFSALPSNATLADGVTAANE